VHHNRTVPEPIEKPYLIFVGGETNPSFAKTGFGLVQWDSSNCLGQMRCGENAVDLGTPDLTIDEAIAAGAKSIVLGVAVVGGQIPQTTVKVFLEALEKGMDVVAGMHERLNDYPALVEQAARYSRRLIDVRVPPDNIPVGTGAPRSGRRLLTVGTDCAVGKKYTALAVAEGLRKQGVDADFRASGQTGILIAGSGIPIDAVVSDFIAGAAEMLSPAGQPDHWDVIEGQGGVLHPGYAAVSVGLLVGSQPDAFVVCTDAMRTHLVGWPQFEVPSIAEVIEQTIVLARRVNPDIRCVGISANTSALRAEERSDYLALLAREYGVPCADPLVSGIDMIVSRIRHDFQD